LSFLKGQGEEGGGLDVVCATSPSFNNNNIIFLKKGFQSPAVQGSSP
jgi:hypothetical protein